MEQNTQINIKNKHTVRQTITTYKLFRTRNEKLYPLYVERKREIVIGKWLTANVGELFDDTHVKSSLGPLALRPGFHSTKVPFTDWIGTKGPDGKLYQKENTIWCECEIEGIQEFPSEKNGKREIPSDWYYYRTKAKQPFPWIISNKIKIIRTLTHEEVESICVANGTHAQPIKKER